MVDGLDLQSISYAAPVILGEWGVTSAEFSIAIAAALAGMAIGASLGGILGDRLGCRRIIFLSALLFGAATLAMGFTDAVGPLALLRLVGGIGFGAMTPNAYALVAEIFPRRAHPRTIGILSIGTPLGGVLGGGLALVVLPALGWSWLFFVCAAFAGLVAVVARVALPESPGFLLARGEPARAVRSLNRVRAGERLAADELESTEAPARAGASREAFRRVNLRVNVGSALGFFALNFLIFAITSWLPSILTTAGLTLQMATIGTLTFSFSNMLGALVSSSVINALGSRACIAVCATTTGLTALLLPVTIAAVVPLPDLTVLLIVNIALAGLAAGISITSFFTVTSNAFDPSCRSTGMGFALAFGRLGAVTTIIASGALLTLTQNNRSLTRFSGHEL
ncbi:MFS transporter [Microbacterium sp. HMH0099]|uniref:MFS transporter n=1 Tax=Microbacterium sp. HMH0099 TaxID=3414026 RepID=UPI003BF6F220